MPDLFSVAEKVFWASAGLMLYAYIGYPLLLFVLSLFSRRKQREPKYFPTLSILIAAYNEEASIGRKLDQTLALDYPKEKLEIIVLSDASSDRTNAIVQSYADRGVCLLQMPRRGGKTKAQNAGARVAQGEILVFSDATTIYHSQALRYLAANYVDPQTGAVSGRYQYFDSEESSPTGLGTMTFWNYENLIKKCQSCISTISGCCGCIYSVRKVLYTDLGADVISDLVQPLWVIQQGYRVMFEDRALAFEETTKSTVEEFKMRVRVVTRGMLGLLSVPELFKPWKYPWIAFQLVSHKILRWLVPFFLIVVFLSNAFLLRSPLYQVAFVLQLLFYSFALLSKVLTLHQRWRLLGLPLYFCTLNIAALMSVIEVFRGRKYVVWETVRTES